EKLLSSGDVTSDNKPQKEIKAEMEATEGLEYHPLEFKVDPSVTYEFRMTKPRKAPKNMPREATVWDEEEGKPKKIRYSKTETSPYIEDQSDYAVTASLPVVWKNGVLKVPGTNEALVRYLLAYDGFAGKKQVLQSNSHIRNEYYLYEPDKVAKAQRE